MKLYRATKAMSLLLVFALIFSFHLCACEEALAVTQSGSNKDAHCPHHESSDSNKGHHESDKADDSSCCTNILAVQSPTNSYTGHQLFQYPSNFIDRVGPSFLFENYLTPTVQKFEFPPGASPPGFFLSAHFTHAPPAFL